MDQNWKEMYRAAKAAQNPRQISPYVEAGSVAAAVLSESGRIYTGVCVDTSCTLGICAKRSAIFRMIEEGESQIRRVLALMPGGRLGPPCGACWELMVQLMPEAYRGIEILMDTTEGRQILTLGEITPAWWI